MAGEIRIGWASGATWTFVVRNPADPTKVWYPAGPAWEVFGTGARTNADYDIGITDRSGDYYVGDFPTGITTAGYYDVVFLLGGVINTVQGIDWDGSARIESADDHAAVLRADLIVHETTIASVTDDKTFVLTSSGLDGDSAADDDAWNNVSVTIEDVTGTAKELRTVEDYGGVAKQVILDRVCKFNLASGDKVKFFPSCTSNVVAAVITDSDKNDIVDKMWDEADADHLTIGTKGLKVHHLGRGRY